MNPDSVIEPSITRFNYVLLILFNLMFWFFLIPFFTPMSYGIGFAVHAGNLFFRFLAGLYINFRNFTPAQYYGFPLRIP